MLALCVNLSLCCDDRYRKFQMHLIYWFVSCLGAVIPSFPVRGHPGILDCDDCVCLVPDGKDEGRSSLFRDIIIYHNGTHLSIIGTTDWKKQ